jgi:DNA-binding XRE family transcriptional regulator
MSQSVFAALLALNKRTLERWEHGKAKPSDTVAVLIRMVHKYPDTIDRIRTVVAATSTAKSKPKRASKSGRERRPHA